jgi:hypothetical protein
MDALAKQGSPGVKSWLQRWRFTNDGVFMVREMLSDRCEYHAPDGSIVNYTDDDKVFN